MRTDAEDHGLLALDAEMDELREAVASGDSCAVRRRGFTVLNRMHSLDDQFAKRLGSNYRGIVRQATPDGQALAALTLVRGIVHHHGIDALGLAWRPTQTLAQVAGEWVPMSRQIWIDGQWRATSRHIAMTVWRPLAELPAPPTGPLYDRDIYYAQHVEGKDRLVPFVAADRFLRSSDTL